MRHYEKVRILLLSRLFGFPIIRNSHTNSALMHVNKERFETTEKIKMYRYTTERELYFFRFFFVCFISGLSSSSYFFQSIKFCISKKCKVQSIKYKV